MASNFEVIDTLRVGSDAVVTKLPNLAVPNLGHKNGADRGLEFKFIADASFYIITVLGVIDLATFYRYIGLLADRSCISCDQLRHGIGCVAGSWRCANCNAGKGKKKGLGTQGPVSFKVGMEQWICSGFLARHVERV